MQLFVSSLGLFSVWTVHLSDISISPLSDPDRFLASWDSLLPRCDEVTFFQSLAWMQTWLSARPDDVELFAVEGMAKDGASLLAVIGFRKVRAPAFIGSAEARLHEYASADHDAVYVEYNDFLVARNAEPDLRQRAIDEILKEIDGPDTFVFRNVTPALAAAITATAPDRRILREQPVFVCDLAAANLTGKDFLQTLGKSLRAKTRRALRKYEERGAVTFRVVQTEQDRETSWNTLIELHQTAWKARGETGIFENPHLIGFHNRLRETTPDKYHLFEVMCGDSPIGVLYNFVDSNRIMNYQSGFRYENDNQLTPGFVCHILAAEYYLKKGYEAYDLLAGDAEYKRRLGQEVTTLTSIAIDRPTWRNQLKRTLKR